MTKPIPAVLLVRKRIIGYPLRVSPGADAKFVAYLPKSLGEFNYDKRVLRVRLPINKQEVLEATKDAKGAWWIHLKTKRGEGWLPLAACTAGVYYPQLQERFPELPNVTSWPTLQKELMSKW
ncbi:MAG TPA: hypothetical protein VLI92_05185 [Candidatus Saccharimonadales bacterium]|nr:hypothetical protein [Candidatus Saccharimonadales bacterium]